MTADPDAAEPAQAFDPPARTASAAEPRGWDPVRDTAIAVALFSGALALRLVYLSQAWEIPFFEHPIVDGRSYDEWARRIAAGDWWGDQVFYQAPAYPYFLGLVYRIFGVDPWRAHVVQMVLGAASCVWLYAATRTLLETLGERESRIAALVAGGGLALYAPALFFDSITQKAVLGLFLTTLWLFTLARFERRQGLGAAIGSGAVLGLLALTRENMLLFAAVLPAWLIARGYRRDARALRKGLATGAAFALGTALVLAPVSLRNYTIGGTLAPTTSQLGPNFYIGNNPDATGLYRPLISGRQTPDFEGSDARIVAERRARRPMSAGEVSSYWLGESVRFIFSQPLQWLNLLTLKALLTLNRFEVPDTEDVYVYAESSWLLRGLLGLFHFGTLLPLAAAGLWIARREAIAAAALPALIAALFAASTAAFYVFARYRFPLVPLLLPFAGLAIARAPSLWRDGMRGSLPGAAAAALAGLVIAWLPLLDPEPFAVGQLTNMGNVRLQQERYEEAERYFERALAVNSENADLHFHLAALRVKQKRPEDAEQHLRTMLSIDDTDFRGHSLLASLLHRRGDEEAASFHRRRARALNPEPGKRGRFQGRSGQERLEALRERRKQIRERRREEANPTTTPDGARPQAPAP